MKYISREELSLLMNRLGNHKTPFVWGVNYAQDRCFLLDDPFGNTDILWEIKGIGNSKPFEGGCVRPNISVTGYVDYDVYAKTYSIIRAGIMRGDCFLANLTAPTEIECDGTLYEIFTNSEAPFKLLIEDEFVCFSPEEFVRIENGYISTFPMKGTIDASSPDAGRILMDDYKETCEHNTIVDLMRNDLNRVSENVDLVRFRYVDRIKTSKGEILQTSSEIRGEIPIEKHYDFGDIILPLLPAGSITGAPKSATVNLIAEAEISPRGWYTGVFGFFDGKTMLTAVMIRCIQRSEDGRLFFHSGGGITVNSDCREEYEELLTKIYLPI